MVAPRIRRRLIWLPALALLACKQDCVLYPCPEFEAVTVTVRTATSTVAPAGTEVLVGAAPGQSVPCNDQGCHVLGGPGQYQLTVQAPRFNPQQLQVTVAGESAGCNTCGHVDRQQVTVVLTPVLPAL